MVEAIGDAPLLLGGLVTALLLVIGVLVALIVRRTRRSRLKRERPTRTLNYEPQIIPAPSVQPAEAGGVDLNVGANNRRVDIDLRPGQLDLGSHRLEMAVSGANPSCVLASISNELTNCGLTLVSQKAPQGQWLGSITSNYDGQVGAVTIVALAPGYWSFLLNVGPSLPLQTIAEQAIVSCGYQRNNDGDDSDQRVRVYLTNNLSHIRASVGGAELLDTGNDFYFA